MYYGAEGRIKTNSPELAQKMAKLCDIYVNDAFGTAHRAEASTYGIAQYAKVACAGPLLAAEIDAITKALAHPRRPLAATTAGPTQCKSPVARLAALRSSRLISGKVLRMR